MNVDSRGIPILLCGLLGYHGGLGGGAFPAAGGTGNPPPAAILMAGIPHVRQKPDFCGEACAETEHFRLVTGYDPSADEVVYHEPAEADGANRRMPRTRFLKLWPLKYAPDRWTVIRLRLEAGNIRDAAPAPGFTPADYAQHVMALRPKIPRKGFTVVVEPPFVVIGDEDPDVVRLRSRQTVGWAVKMLKQDYFTRDPDTIIDVWLFRDDESYRKHARAIFHDNPSTPFGYYSATENALIMNIATGGGTLVHEIVHPFMRANFPACPAWLNEGLGSLYEQSEEKDGHIRGRTNWRLAGLQQAIRRRQLPSVAELTAASNSEFYNADRGNNYAQARYLCYYLQEHGLLIRFFREFVAWRQADPTGLATLKNVLGEPDMDAFAKRWSQFVLELTFP